MDVKYVFLRVDLQEQIYMEQTLGYVQNDSLLVYHVKKPIYGLKQDHRALYAKMDIFLLDIDFSRCHYDSKVYSNKVASHLIILFLNLDYLFLIGSDPKILNHLKTVLKKKFN
jgi:hypothetical protein